MSTVICAPSQPTYADSRCDTRRGHVTPNMTSRDPTEGISHALWGMKPSFTKDPSLERNTRNYLDSRIDTLCGYTKSLDFPIPPSQASAMRTLTSAVDQAQKSLVPMMSAIPMSQREEARRLLKQAYGAVFDLMASAPALSTNQSRSRSTSALRPRSRIRAPKAVHFSPPTTVQTDLASHPRPATIFTRESSDHPTSVQIPQTEHVEPVSLPFRCRPQKARPSTSEIASTSVTSTIPATSTHVRALTSSGFDKTPVRSGRPSRPAVSRKPPVHRTNIPTTLSEPLVSDLASSRPESGMIPIAEWIERARQDCLDKTGKDGGWGNAVEWLDPSGPLGMFGMLEQVSGMGSQDWGEINRDPMAWGEPRWTGVKAPEPPIPHRAGRGDRDPQ